MGAALLAHLVAALCAPALFSRAGRSAFLLLALVPAATFGWLLSLAHRPLGAAPLVEQHRWIAGLGLHVTLELDGVRWLFALVVTVVGAVVLAYCAWYFRAGERDLPRFAATFVGFAGAMLGLVLAENLIALYVFWEATTVLSFLLIGHNPERRANRQAAMTALIVTTFGGLAMLGGILLLGASGGSFDAGDLIAAPPTGTTASVAAALLLLGALSKSAIVPFSFWLPGAMAAPTPVSAFLHAAAMVKAGVFLVALLAPAFSADPVWRGVLVSLGAATFLWGGWRALRERDIKLLLAFGTVSQLGLVMLLLGVGTPSATLAAVALTLAHAAFKAALFMVVGVVARTLGTRDIAELDRAGRRLPLATGAALLAVAAMVGVPPTLGFLAKEGALGAAVSAGPGAGWALAALLTLGFMVTGAYGLRFCWALLARRSSSGRDADGAALPVAAGPGALPPTLLALAGVALTASGPGLSVILGTHLARLSGPAASPLALGHGWTPALALTVASWLGAVAVFVAVGRRIEPASERAGRAWDAVVRAVERLAVEVTARTQSGSLPLYLSTLLIALVALATPSLVAAADGAAPGLATTPVHLALATAAIGATVIAVRARRRLRAVICVGATGYATAFLSVVAGAPDVALTQFLTETLLLVVFVLALRRQPDHFSRSPFRGTRWRSLALGVVIGALAGGITLLAAAGRSGPRRSDDFAGLAAAAQGRNIVNVILVDIRAWDTLGEISVLVVAATGVASLVHRITGRSTGRHRAERAGPAPPGPGQRWLSTSRPPPPRRRSVLFEVVARLLFHPILLFACYLLLVGHHAPGGGFVAGLVAGLAFVVRYLAGGKPELDEATSVDAGLLLGGGLTLAVLTALVPLAFGAPPLASFAAHADLPLLGPVHVGTGLLFDTGVFLIVVGLVLDVVRSLGAGIDSVAAQEPAWT